jgi:uncharacterized protein (DUF2141 family)
VPTGSLEIGVDHLRSGKGMVRVCLTADPDNFPKCVDDARAIGRSIPAAAHALTISGLPRGGYAVSVIHDENGNNKLDTLAGIPREGYGFSNDAPVRFGPPKFAAARFTVAGDANRQQITMRYIL